MAFHAHTHTCIHIVCLCMCKCKEFLISVYNILANVLVNKNKILLSFVCLPVLTLALTRRHRKNERTKKKRNSTHRNVSNQTTNPEIQTYKAFVASTLSIQVLQMPCVVCLSLKIESVKYTTEWIELLIQNFNRFQVKKKNLKKC